MERTNDMQKWTNIREGWEGRREKRSSDTTMACSGCCLRLRFGPNLSLSKDSRWRETEGISHPHFMLGKRAKWDGVQIRRIGLHSRSSRRPGREIDRVSGRGAIFKSAMPTAREPDEEADELPENATGASISSKYPCMYVKKSISSGEIIKYQGTIVVLGDVENGGIVMADGDIIVLGRLQGKVYCGQSGDRRAVVYAARLDGLDIQIGGTTMTAPKSYSTAYPAIASVQEDGTVSIRAAVHEVTSETTKDTQSIDQRKASKRPSQLAMFTGVYIAVVGMALLLYPTKLFGLLFDVRSVTVGWIRVGAILAVVFGVYYIGTAFGDLQGHSGARAFYMSTVVGRMFLFVGFTWLVAVGAAQSTLLLVGTVNMMGAVSMLIALRKSSTPKILGANP